MRSLSLEKVKGERNVRAVPSGADSPAAETWMLKKEFILSHNCEVFLQILLRMSARTLTISSQQEHGAGGGR
ncbi:MAG: hypothetical protein K5657_10220 [Desulfovibrio sp.]|nr:hypothetical protein [Desulfovibrio sp.]